MNLATPVRDFVVEDFRTAPVFKKLGIDFCCNGKATIGEACEAKGISIDDVAAALAEAKLLVERPSDDYATWQLDKLSKHIVETHHKFVRTRLPEIQMFMDKVCQKHGDKHPEVFEIAKHFAAVREELTSHMMKEERILFPVIEQLAAAQCSDIKAERAPFGSIRNPIMVMESEHENAGNGLAMIAKLSNGYTPPDDACNGFRVLYQLLEEFENDLHLHVHLENNILFPKAIELEAAMFA